jgi:L-threonylcarbamoyladenylate synthase
VLSEKGSVEEAAGRLFEVMHEVDGGVYKSIHAEEAPAHGLGLAINDRLGRAASR